MIFFAIWCAFLLGMLWLWDRRPIDPAHPGLKTKVKVKAKSGD